MKSVLVQSIEAARAKKTPSGHEIAELLRDSSRLIPYLCRYIVHKDADVRYIAADALFKISRTHRSNLVKYLDHILRGLKFQDVKTRRKILETIAPIVQEYPTRVECYLATISQCLYNSEAGALRTAASSCLSSLASLDERRSAIYIPMMLQCIQKFKTQPETWKTIRALSAPLRTGNAKRNRKRIREVVLPFRRRGSNSQRQIVRRILKLTLI